MSDSHLEIKLFAIFLAFVMVGWGLYSTDYDRCDAEVSLSSDGIDVNLKGLMPQDYRYEILSGADVPEELYFYYDESLEGITTSYVQLNFFNTLNMLLDIRGSVQGQFADASGLQSMMASGSPAGRAVVFASGAVPYNLYSDSSHILKDWICSGGTVYWMGKEMGTVISYPDGPVKHDAHDFFPEGSISTENSRNGSNQSEWSELLGITYTECSTGLNINMFPGSVSVGFTDDEGYSTMAACPFENGRVYVAGDNMAADNNATVTMVLADTISSGIDFDTVLLSQGAGHKGYGDQTVTIEADVQSGDVLRLVSGSPYVSWGIVKTF